MKRAELANMDMSALQVQVLEEQERRVAALVVALCHEVRRPINMPTIAWSDEVIRLYLIHRYGIHTAHGRVWVEADARSDMPGEANA